jgi:signal transduction histidine kinase/CheY-like chemotaxis protein
VALFKNHQPTLREHEVKLMLKNVSGSFLPAFLLTFLVVACLYGSVSTLNLGLWGLGCAALKWAHCVRARFWLAQENPLNLNRIYQEFRLLNVLYGAVWGLLIWVGMYQETSDALSIFINTVINGVAIATLILLSPVPGVFSAFIWAEYLSVIPRYFYLGGITNYSLSIAAVACVLILQRLVRNIYASLKESFDLRHENTGLLELLTQESHKTKLAFKEAVEAHLAKSRFLAAASHDLRQPIHALGLYHELLSRKNTAPELKGILKSAVTVTQSFSGMLDALLDYSRIEAGAVQPQIQTFKLQNLIDKLEPEFAPQANAKDLYYRTRESDFLVASDPALMELIFRNLISNAIRYTQQGGILVACRSKGDFVSVQIWDTGVGIAESEQECIYEEFRQIDNPERDRAKGLGLGLAIVKGLVGLLGLRIQLKSQWGRGSVFSVLIPKSQADDQVLQPKPIKALSEFGKIRVLAIDDDAFVRDAIRQILFEMGCECDVVANLNEAKVSAEKQRPDVILSDYMLRENRSGIQAIKQLREAFGAGIPAVVTRVRHQVTQVVDSYRSPYFFTTTTGSVARF